MTSLRGSGEHFGKYPSPAPYDVLRGKFEKGEKKKRGMRKKKEERKR
jgi:hypothetical protein